MNINISNSNLAKTQQIFSEKLSPYVKNFNWAKLDTVVFASLSSIAYYFFSITGGGAMAPYLLGGIVVTTISLITAAVYAKKANNAYNEILNFNSTDEKTETTQKNLYLNLLTQIISTCSFNVIKEPDHTSVNTPS